MCKRAELDSILRDFGAEQVDMYIHSYEKNKEMYDKLGEINRKIKYVVHAFKLVEEDFYFICSKETVGKYVEELKGMRKKITKLRYYLKKHM